MSRASVPILFECAGQQLLGLYHPPESQPEVVVVVVVGGPQYRVGSHRMFVELAEMLAAEGVGAFRFDCRGMGDSDGEFPSFDKLDEDIRCAVNAAVGASGTGRVVLFGLCDGASAGVIYAHCDARVKGLVALNPWVSSGQVQARTQVRHYYTRRLLTRDFWRQLVRGGVDLRRSGISLVASLWQSVGLTEKGRSRRKEHKSYVDRMFDGMTEFEGRVLILLSENDLVAREFEEMVKLNSLWSKQVLDYPRVAVEHLPGMDHTLSSEEGVEPLGKRLIEFISYLQRPRSSGERAA